MNQTGKQRSDSFELEALEPRVLLSADAALASAFAGAALAHKQPVEAVQMTHHDVAGGQEHFQDAIHYSAAGEGGGIFEGVSSQPMDSHAVVSESNSGSHSGTQSRAGTEEKSGAVEAQSQVETTAVVPQSLAKSHQVESAISPTSARISFSTVTQQLTQSLKAANAPPANPVNSQVASNLTVTSNLSSAGGLKAGGSSSVPTPENSTNPVDLLQSINTDLNAIASGSSPSPINLGDATLAGVLSAQGVQLSFSGLTISGGTVTSGTVTITASSASLNLGGAVTSSVGAITGTYNIGTRSFSLTLNSVNVAFSSFVNISANSASLSYDSSASTTATLSDGSTTPVSLLTVGVSGASVFAGVNGPVSNANAEGLSLTGVNLALAMMSTSGGNSYYGLEVSGGTLAAVGLPGSLTLSSSNLKVDVNGASSGSTAVNFDTTFGAGTGLAVSTGSGNINLDFQQPVVQASGTVELNFNGFVYVNGSMAFQTGTTSTVTLSDGSTTQVSVLEVGADSVTIFAGVNGPATNSGAVGVEVTGADFALALFKPTASTDTSSYFALAASATSLSAVGMPSGVTVSAGDLNIQINGGTGGNVVNLDTSFTPGTGLTVQTGGAPINLDYTAQLTQVSGSLTMAFSSYISLSGGFAFSQSGGTITINIGESAYSGAPALSFSLGSGSTTFFSATGGLAMSFDANSITITTATLTVTSGFNIPNVLAVASPSVTLSNITINKATGQITGAVVNGNPTDPDLSISAGSATVLPGNSTVTASVTPTTPGDNGLQGVFNLQTGAFRLTLQQFALTVGSVFSASASDVVISYNPTDTDPHQQLVSIGSGTIRFNLFSSPITGSVTNLVIYADGFQFGSLTVGYTGSLNLGSILSVTDPSITLTNFSVTFGSGNASFTETGSLTVSVSGTSLNLGPISASASNLTITVNLDPSSFGQVSITAGTLGFQFSSYLAVQATNISINPTPGNGGAYLTVGTATATVSVTSSFTIGGSASNFSVIDNNGTPEFQAGTNFGFTLTPPSPSQLGLPSWIGFSVSQFGITWADFTNHPDQFQITLSASINSIQGLPGGVTVSGSITDMIIDVGQLGAWLSNPSSSNFPISFGPSGGIGGSVSGTLFGMNVSATFVGGIVSFNQEGGILTGTSVIGPGSGDTTVYGSGFYIGIQGAADIPGIGNISISLGFSNLGPLTFYLSYTGTTPLILDPDSGLAITGFSAGVAFNQTMQTPSAPTDLPTVLSGALTAITGSPTGSPSSVNVAQWQQNLELATAAQYVASGGGTNLTAAYSQPFLILASVTLDDAYLSPDAVQIVGSMVLGINPNPAPSQAPVSILISGSVTLGGSSALSAANGYLYASVSSSSASLMFLVNEPGSAPIESFGGSLTFGFTQNGNPWSSGDAGSPNGFTMSLSGFFEYSALGFASVSIQGTVTLSVTPNQMTIDLSGDVNVSFLGDLGDATGEFVLLYPGSTYTGTSAPNATSGFTNNSGSIEIYGALELSTGAAFSKLASYGLTVNGAALFQVNTTGNDVLVNLPPVPSSPPGTPATPFVIQGSVLFDMTITGTSTAYATISYEVSGTTLFQMQGFFDLRLTNDAGGLGLQMFADINTLTLGPSSSPFLSFSGFGLFVINGQGLAAEINLTLNVGNPITGISFSANFDLVINTTSQDVTFNIPSVTVPTSASGSTPVAGVTVYNSDGSVAGTVTSLVIPAGPPQGSLQIIGGSGAYATTGAAGPYIVVTGSGALNIEGLSLSGYFYFQMSYSTSSGFVLALVVNVSGNVPPVGSATVTGALEISSAGEVALLAVSGNLGSSTSYGTGISLQVNAELGINTTSSDVTQIGGIPLTYNGSNVTLHAGSFQVLASGTLTLNLGGGTGFVINGVFSTTVQTTGSGTSEVDTTTITASGTLTATVGGSNLLTMTATGVLIFTSGAGATHPGMAAELTLTLGGGSPLDGSGFSFNGSFDLEVNTTGAQQSVPVGTSHVTITAGPGGSSTPADYAEVHANGTLTFGTASNGFALAGDFYLTVSSVGLDVSTSVSFTATVGGSTLMTLNASGAMEITSAGLAASFTLTVTSGSPFSMSGAFSFSGTFTLQINTTNQAINSIGGTTVNLPQGPYFQVAITGPTLGSNATLRLGSSAGLELDGSFVLTVSPTGMAVSATATLKLFVGSTTFFSLTADGALLINNHGIAAKLTLGTGSQPGNSQFSFSATFVLEVNTTGSAISTINNQTVNLPGGAVFFRIEATGSLVLGGVVTISGSFDFTLSGSSVEISLNAGLSIFGVLFTVSGNAGLYSDGIALNIDLSLGGSTSPTVTIIPGVLALSGSFDLKVNTTGNSHFGINSNTLFDVYVNASFNVFGFSLATTTFHISESGGVFSATGQVDFNFFGFATLTVDFYFDSNGNYWFYGNTYVQLGSDSFNIHGSLTVEFASNSEIGAWDSFSSITIAHNFYLHVDGGVTAFHYTFASIGADVSINGSDVSISVYVSVNLGLFSVGGTVTIDLGSINPPPAPPPPPPIAILNNGVLTLNIGPGATLPAQPNQNYTITLAADSGTGSTENLWVNDPGVYTGPAEYSGTSNSVSGAPGGTVEYTGVTSIVVNTGDNNTSINIDSSVTLPVTITSGTGTNTYVTGGGATGITGQGGADTVIGGSGNVTFTMNGGTAVFAGGPAHNIINNDPGTLTVVLGGSSAHDYNHYDLNGSVLSFWDDGGTHYSDTINGPATINLTTPSTGTAAFSVENFPGSDFSLTLNGNGNTGASLSVTDNGNLDLNGNTVGAGNGSISLQSITSVTLIGGSAGDHLSVTNSSDIATVNLQGNAGGESFTVNFQGSGYDYAVNVTGSGAGNTLTINGTNADNTYNINGSPVTLGSETVNYSGIQDLVLYTFNGNDTVNIGNTSTTTTVNGGSGTDIFNVQAIGNAVTVNLGSGTNTVNVGTLAPTVSGGTLNSIQALLSVNGGNGGTDTLYLDDSADNSAATATLTATSLTGVFGAGGSLNYSGITNFNLYLGSGDHTMNVQGMSGTVDITLGSGTNIINIGSNAGAIVTDPTTGNAANTGSTLDQILGTLNLTGTGANTFNLDDSGGSTALEGALTPTSVKFIDPITNANLVTINLPNVVAINMALSQADDVFVISDTFTSSSTSPVIVIDGDGGNDMFVILDTHAVMTLNGGDGQDSFYNFGNSAVLNLNGDAGDDSFYVYASVSENTTNVGPGAADSNGNQVYSYRVNAPVNINGGTGNDKLYIFGTVLNDVITISGTQVSGAGIDVNFTNIEQLTVEGLGGNDTFYIESISIPTTIVGDGSIVPIPTQVLEALGITPPNLNGNAPPATSFNDTFYVGWQGASYIPGSLAGIAAPLTIEGDNGPTAGGTTINTAATSDTIYVSDTADTTDRQFTLTSTTLSGDAFGAGGSLIYDGAVENLNVSVGPGNNLIIINGTGTATQTSIYGNSGNDTFVVNDSNGGALASPLALFGGLNTFAGDTLTINGAPDGNTFDLTGFTIDGAGATISYEEMEQLTINAGGATTFNVNGDSIPTYLNGGGANDTFNVNSNVVSLYLSGGAGSDSFVINANAGTLTASGDAGNDSFLVNGNSGVLSLNGGAGDDAFTVNSLSASASINGGTGNDSVTVNAPLSASLTVNGGGDSQDWLTINGTPGNDYFTVSGSAVSGVGAAVNYGGTNLVINGIAGNDTFQIAGTSAETTRVNGGTYGNDTFDVQSTTGTLYLTGGAVGNNVFNLGSLAPVAGGALSNLAGPVFITGGTNLMRLITLASPGLNTVNLDDSGDGSGASATLTSSTLTGLGMGAGVTFVSINAMNLYLGPGNDTLNVQGTNSTTVTTVHTGGGANLINVGANAPGVGGTTDGVQGALIVVGGGGDTLNVDNTGDAAGQTGFLTATNLSGLGMGAAGVTYSGLAALNINLGTGNDTFNVQGTSAATVTTLNTGAGANLINIGSLAPAAGGVVDNIQGALIVVGNGSDTMNVDDTGSLAAKTGFLSASTLTGLGMGAGGITYSGLATLTLSLGSGGNTFTINDTSAATATTLNSGSGNDTVTLAGDSGVTTINGQDGNDTINVLADSASTNVNGQNGNDVINVRSTGAVTNVNTGSGVNLVNVGSLAPGAGGVVDGIQGALTVVGNGNDTMNVDDTGSSAAKIGSLSSSALTGLGMGASGISYGGLATLIISLGSGGNTFTIAGTNASTATTLNSGSGNDVVNLVADSGATKINSQDGNDTINVQATGAATTVNTGSGVNIVNLGSLAPAAGGIMDNIQGALIVIGDGSDTMNVDDTGSAAGKSGWLTSSTITGLGMGAGGITYSGLAILNVNLGAGNDVFNIQSTNAATATNLNTGAGANVVNVGSLAPATGGVLDPIQGALVITGSGADTLNVDDSGAAVNETGTLTPTTITGLGMGSNGITYTGMAALNIVLGSGNDSFTVNEINVPTVTTINGGPGIDTATLNFAQDFAGTLTLLGFENGTLNVGRDFLGTLSDTGPGGLQQVTIGRNFLGTLTAGTISLMTIGGAAPGRIIVDSMGTLYAPADTGNLLLDITQGGVRRQIVATPVTGLSMPGSAVFSIVYDGASATSPQAAIRVTNGSPTTSADDVRFDLSLVTFSTSAKFNLSRIDANGTSGLRNITVDGDLLLTVTAPESAYLGYAAGTIGGVYLPQDNLTGVEVRDDAKVGSVTALSIMGVAFSTLTGSTGTESASSLNGLGAQLMMTSSTHIILAVDVFRVRFGENSRVVLFMDSTNDGHLNDADVIFTDQIVDNASVTAIVTMSGPAGAGTKRSYIQSINFIGDGGSVDTTLQVAGSISSTGALGDIYLRTGTGIANITASSFFGNIDLFGGTLTGTLQSTGIRIDPLTGAQTAVSADIGRAITNAAGQIIGVTTLNAIFAGTARLVARGNLVSQVNCGGAMAGVIAAQGNIGVIQQNPDGTAALGSNGQLLRFGGISISGNDTGQVIALGNLFGNVTVGGTLSGRIGVEGQGVAGLAVTRYGILGNLTAGSFAAGGAIVSGGLAGDSTGGTGLSLGSGASGFIAAEGSANLATGTTLHAGNLLQNVSGSNLSAISAIFTDGGSPLLFDTGGSLNGLGLIQTDLINLQDNGGVLSGTIP